VFHNVAHSLIVAMRPHTSLACFPVLPKPIMPFLSFSVRVTNEYVAINPLFVTSLRGGCYRQLYIKG